MSQRYIGLAALTVSMAIGIGHSIAAVDEYGSLTAEMLMSFCGADADSGVHKSCEMYLKGAADALNNSSASAPHACMRSATLTEVRLAFVRLAAQRLENHPQDIEAPAAKLVAAVLPSAFACPSKK